MSLLCCRRTYMRLGVVLCLALVAPPAAARELRPPTRAEFEAAMPLLGRGSVALGESDERGWLRQVAIASIYDAPRALVFRTMADVARYPDFLQNFSEIDVRQSRDRLLEIGRASCRARGEISV